MSRNDLVAREQEARSIVGAKAKQISVLVGKDEAKTSKFMSALVQLSQNKNLIECKVDSIVDVGFQIVQAGLNPNPLFGQAYVVPFKRDTLQQYRLANETTIKITLAIG